MANDRAVLKDAATVAGLPSDGLLTKPAPIPARDQDTVKTPRIQSVPSERTPTIEDANLTVSAPSAPLMLASPPQKGGPSRALFAGLGAAVAVAVVAVVVLQVASTTEPVLPEAPLAVLSTTTTEAATTTAPSDAGVNADVEATTPLAAPSQAPLPSPVASPPATTPSTKTKRPKPTTTTTTTTTKAPTPPALPPTSTKAKPTGTPKPSATAPLSVQLRWLLSRCPTSPCAQAVAPQKDSWGSLSPSALQSYRGQVTQCLAKCQ